MPVVARFLLVCAVALIGSADGFGSPLEPPGEAPAVEPTPFDTTWAKLESAGLAPIERRGDEVGPPLVLRGATVMTASGVTYADGWLAMVDGRIWGVGEGEPPEVPGAAVVDVGGAILTPGLIDTHSHLGVYASPSAAAHRDGNEATSPVTAGVWAEHAVWPEDPGFELALAGGVTTLQVLPGSANLVGGRGVILHLVPARGARAMRLPGAPETLKMACGENPKRVYGERSSAPSTRMGNLRGQRAAFFEAKALMTEWEDYAEKHAKWEAAQGAGKKKRKATPGDEPRPPARDLGKETLIGVLRGEILPQIHCYRADDMLAMLQLADEQGFQIRSFHHAVEAYKIRDVLAEQGVATSTWADWWGFKLEAYDGIPQTLALLTESGAMGVVHSDSPTGIQRLNQEAGKSMWVGRAAGIEVSRDEALRWITANPAWVLGIDDQVGTLEVGKRADVVLWQGDPFGVYGRPQKVWIDGVERFDRDRRSVESDYLLGREVTP